MKTQTKKPAKASVLLLGILPLVVFWVGAFYAMGYTSYGCVSRSDSKKHASLRKLRNDCKADESFFLNAFSMLAWPIYLSYKAGEWFIAPEEYSYKQSILYSKRLLYSKYDTEKNKTEAKKWTIKAAELGHKLALHDYAVKYAKDLETIQDNIDVIHSVPITTTTEQSKTESQWRLGSVQSYRKSAEQGYAEAQWKLATIYSQNIDKTQQSKALNWYLKAANQGHVKAQIAVADMLYTGLVVPKNYQRAAYWYAKAVGYTLTLQVLLDIHDTINWFPLLKPLNKDAHALYSLGLMYQHGHGVLQSNTKAIHLYQFAVLRGHTKAQNQLTKLMRNARSPTQNKSVLAK